MLISVVIPVFNEESSLRTLVGELLAVARQNDYGLEIILVDDGSTDQSWSVIQQLAQRHQNVRGVRFRTNCGKSEALQAGFQDVTGDITFTLDADLQDDPAEIPAFVAKLDEGWDLVSGWKKERRDPWSRRFASRIFNLLVNALSNTQLHDHNCGFKCYRPEVIRDLRIYGELHRFLTVLAASRGFRVTEIEVHHRPREFGKSKYGWRRIPSGLLDVFTVSLLLNCRGRPQHALGIAGLVVFLASALCTVILTAWWFISRQFDSLPDLHLHQRALFYYALAGLLLGAQLLSLGFLAELFSWTFHRERTHFSVVERTEATAESP